MNRRNRKKRFTGQVSLMEEVKTKNIFETPQRDERLGWTGDAEIFCRTACFLENTYSFYRKWLRDVEADQTEEGGVAHVVPDIISGNEGDNWLLEQGSHSAAARRFKIPGNTVEFVRDLRYNKYRVFTELQNEQKKKGVWQNDRHCTCKTGIREISG